MILVIPPPPPEVIDWLRDVLWGLAGALVGWFARRLKK